MKVDAGIVGGSGVGNALLRLGGRRVAVSTREGLVRGSLLERDGRRVLLLPRHGRGHKTPPHAVPYGAMALALRELGARVCFATAAVGSLTTELPVETVLVPDGLIDATGRNLTLHARSVVHTPFPSPFHPDARQALRKAAERAGIAPRDGGTYLGANGPRFETPEEIRMFRAWGGDVVGMTASTEAVAMAEAGVPYALLALVTNLGCGLGGEPPSDEEVQVLMRGWSDRIAEVLIEACQTYEPPVA